MRRLTRVDLSSIIRQYKKGHSLRRISKESGVAKSTIYYHTRKEFGRRYVQMVFNCTPTEALGEFLGLFAADGCFYIDRKRYHYTLTISLSRNQLQYARIIQGKMGVIIGKRPRIDVKNKIVQLVTRGKALGPFLKNYLSWKGRKAHSIHFRESSLRLGPDFLKGVLRGLIAGDGGVYPPKPRIAFGVVSRKLARQFALLLQRFGISSNSYSVRYQGKKTLYHVQITGKANLEKFKLRVGLTDPTRVRLLNLALRR